jgi:hypothetical protein
VEQLGLATTVIIAVAALTQAGASLLRALATLVVALDAVKRASPRMRRTPWRILPRMTRRPSVATRLGPAVETKGSNRPLPPPTRRTTRHNGPPVAR